MPSMTGSPKTSPSSVVQYSWGQYVTEGLIKSTDSPKAFPRLASSSYHVRVRTGKKCSLSVILTICF